MVDVGERYRFKRLHFLRGRCRLAVAALVSFITLSVHAATLPLPLQDQGNYLSLGMAYDIAKVTDKGPQSIPTGGILPPDIDTPTGAKGALYLSMGLGHYWHFQRRYFSTLRLGALLQHGQTPVHGNVDEYGFPWADNYTYKYAVTPTVLLGTVSTDVLSVGRVHWFLQAGIGAAYTVTTAYREVGNVTYPRDSLAFASRGRWNFAYLAGTGARWQLNADTLMSVSYEYLNTGKAVLGTSAVRPGVHGPVLKLHHHLIQLTFTHLF